MYVLRAYLLLYFVRLTCQNPDSHINGGIIPSRTSKLKHTIIWLLNPKRSITPI